MKALFPNVNRRRLGLLWALLRVTILCLLVYLFLGGLAVARLQRPNILLVILKVLLGGGLVLCYSRIIYRRLPSCGVDSSGGVDSSSRRPLISLGFGVAICSAVLALFFVLATLAAIFFAPENVKLAKFGSPANNLNEIWLYYDGNWQGSDLYLYVKQRGRSKQFVSRAGFGGWGYVQWTNDGEAIICSCDLWDEKGYRTGKSVKMAAYDFDKNKATLPPWGSPAVDVERNMSKVMDFQPTMEAIIKAHGGLTKQKFDGDAVKRNGKRVWFWQFQFLF